MCETQWEIKTKIYVHHQKKNGLTDVNIIVSKDWRMEASRSTH